MYISLFAFSLLVYVCVCVHVCLSFYFVKFIFIFTNLQNMENFQNEAICDIFLDQFDVLFVYISIFIFYLISFCLKDLEGCKKNKTI